VIRLLQEIHDQTSGNALDFEGFLKELTNRIVFGCLYREILSLKKEEKLISTFWTSREKDSST